MFRDCRRGSNTQGLVNTAEIAAREVEGRAVWGLSTLFEDLGQPPDAEDLPGHGPVSYARGRK